MEELALSYRIEEERFIFKIWKLLYWSEAFGSIGKLNIISEIPTPETHRAPLRSDKCC
jgi:hypothetical protein